MLQMADHDGTTLTSYTLTNYDTPVYSVNTTLSGYYRTDDYSGGLTENKRDYITQRAGTENDWNAKLVWHTGDEGPTLYLDGFKIETYNTEYSAWLKRGNQTFYHCAFLTGSTAPLKIVLTGEDSYIRNYHGIHYQNKLSIESEGDTKLTMYTVNTGIVPSSFTTAVYDSTSTYDDVIGYTLTLDANLDICTSGSTSTKTDSLVTDGTYVVEDWNFGIVSTREADLIINGGNITVVGSNGQGHRNGALQANGMLIINGGVINASAKKAVGMNGYLGVEINGGEINVIAPWYGITSGYSYRDENSVLKHVLKPININGGTLTIMAERSFYGGTTVTIGEGVMAYAGAGKKNAEVYDGKDTKLISKPWFFSTDDESKFIVIEEEEEDDDSILDIPTAPTTAHGTGAPSDATGVPGVSDPTGATVPEGDAPGEEIPDDEIPEEEYWDSNIYVDYVEGDMDVIPDALIEIGMDSVDAIWENLLEMMWNVDEYINRVFFFDAVPWFYDGEQWIFADEEHLPEDGCVTVVLPYPEGTDMDTEFTALHMFTTDTFGMTPGDVELLMPVNTEDGVELELTGLSPVMLGWVDYDDTDDNFATGDADVTMFFTMMLFSVLGMATVVLLNKKRTV